MPKKLTQKRLKELLYYDPGVGAFVWENPSSNRVKKEGVAGSINNDGYRRIIIDGKSYKASRLAWLYVEGYFPEHQIDHINRIRDDDRWKNLRHVSQLCNARNCNISINNKSGITGVYWDKANKKWKAQITISGKGLGLGYFQNKISAVYARWEAEVKHDFPNCNTTSSAYLYLKGRRKSSERAFAPADQDNPGGYFLKRA